MNNGQISELFQEMAVLLELEGANPFRIRAYQRAAQVLAGLPQPVAGQSEAELLAIGGIGKGIASHLAELKGAPVFKELAELRAKTPKGLLELLKVQGLGPKRAKAVFSALKVDSLESLAAACRAGKLRGLPGFGEKLESSILKGLEYASSAGQRMNYWEARALMDELLGLLRDAPGVSKISPAGSLRRGRETVGDLDILCAGTGTGAISKFTRLPQVERVLAAGDTKASVLLKAGIQCDLRVVPPASFGAALQYFTGSKDHNVVLRERAQKLGLTVNEYGVFRVSDKEQKKPLAGKTEEEVYAKLGLAWIAPELRENRGELEAAAKDRLPRLVEFSDIRGDFHNHSTHSDGRNSLEEMARAAKDQGWEWTALGDHSQSLKVANGLSVERLKASFRELSEIQAKVKGIRLLRSMEVDILKDGSLDYPDAVLKEIGVVIGSVHSSFAMPEPEMTARIRRAAKNPHLDIVGHLTGRLLSRREAYAVDAEAVLAETRGAGAAIEVNGQPERQDLTDVTARRAREVGTKLAVSTDAHSAGQFEYMKLAVVIARRAWLRKEDLLNCLSYKDLEKWLSRKD